MTERPAMRRTIRSQSWWHPTSAKRSSKKNYNMIWICDVKGLSGCLELKAPLMLRWYSIACTSDGKQTKQSGVEWSREVPKQESCVNYATTPMTFCAFSSSFQIDKLSHGVKSKRFHFVQSLNGFLIQQQFLHCKSAWCAPFQLFSPSMQIISAPFLDDLHNDADERCVYIESRRPPAPPSCNL